jgi:hypothetical protein
MKLSRTYQVSFCEITPLNTCPERSRSACPELAEGIRGTREVREITPFNPPNLKGEIPNTKHQVSNNIKAPNFNSQNVWDLIDKGEIGEGPPYFKGDVEGVTGSLSRL